MSKINEMRKLEGIVGYLSRENSVVLSENVNLQIEATKGACLKILFDYAKSIYDKTGGFFPVIFSLRNTTETYNPKDIIYILDSYLTHIKLDEEKLEEVPVVKDGIYESGNFDFRIIDHHGTYYNKIHVATTLVLKLLKKFKRQNPNFEKYGLLEDIKNPHSLAEGTILHTKGTIDTDSVLSHFCLLYPELALENKKIITQAALKGDLNLNVSSEKAVSLNHLITGLVFICSTIRKDFEKYLSDLSKEIGQITKSLGRRNPNYIELIQKLKEIIIKKVHKNEEILKLIEEFETEVSQNNSDIKARIPGFIEQLNAKIELYNNNSLQEFDTITGNTGIGMVPDMLKYLNDLSLEGKEYDILFRYAKNYFSKFVDEGVGKIESGLQSGEIKQTIKGNTIFFDSQIPLSFSGIPIEAYFNYVRANANFSSLKYLVVSVIRNGDSKKKEISNNGNNGSDGNNGNTEESSPKNNGKLQKRFISLSAFAQNIQSLRKIDLENVLVDLKKQELEKYFLVYQEKIEEFKNLIYIIEELNGAQFSEEKCKNIEDILTIFTSNYFINFDNENLNNAFVKARQIIFDKINKNSNKKSNIDKEQTDFSSENYLMENMGFFNVDENLLLKICQVINEEPNLKIKSQNISKIKSGLVNTIIEIRNLKRKMEEVKNGSNITFRTGLILLRETVLDKESVIDVLNKRIEEV